MKRWLVALTLACGLTADAQPLTGGLLGRGASYSSFVADPSCASGYTPYFNASLKLVCSPTVYAPATDTTTSTGTIAARNLTATALVTPVITPPVSPVLSLLTTVTVVAGASLADGDYFTLSDGSAVVYEFDTGDGVTSGRVPIVIVGDETAQEIRDLVVIAINGSTLGATAIAAAADTLTVTSDTAGDTMGVNSENVTDAGFLVPVWGPPTAATTYGYKVEACLASGECAPSAEVQTTTGHATLNGANYNSVTWGAVTGTSYYKLTRVTGTPAGGDAPPRLLYTGTLLNFNDTNATSTSEAVATVNETGVLTGRGVLGRGTTVAAGASAGTLTVGGSAATATVPVATSGTSEEVLATYTIPASALSVNGRGVRVSAVFTTAANGNGKVMRLKLGGLGGTQISARNATDSGANVRLYAEVLRTGAAEQVYYGTAQTGASWGSFHGNTALDTTGTISLVATATTGTAAGDVTLVYWLVEGIN